MELPVRPHQFHADRRIIETRQAARGDRIQELLANQLLAKPPQVGRADIDEGLQRGFAGAEIGALVARDLLQRVERAAITKEHAEVAQAVAQRSVVRVSKLLCERVPRSGFRGLAPAGETIRHAVQDVRLHSDGLGGGELEQLIQRRGIFLDVLGETSGDELAREWQLGLRSEYSKGGRVGVGDGNQPIPDQQGEVVVVRVLRVGEQRRSEVSTLRYWQTLQRRSQSETDQTRGV